MLRRLLARFNRPATREVIVVRLNTDVYNAFRAQLGGGATCTATAQTTDIQAGYMLGINYVLNKLQEGIVIEGTLANRP